MKYVELVSATAISKPRREQNATSIAQMARSVDSVAQNGRHISEAATGAATSAVQMERTIRAVPLTLPGEPALPRSSGAPARC